MPTRKLVRKAPCPNTVRCADVKGKCQKPNPRTFPWKQMGFTSLEQWMNTLPNPEANPKKYRQAMCADMYWANKMGAPKGSDDMVQERRKVLPKTLRDDDLFESDDDEAKTGTGEIKNGLIQDIDFDTVGDDAITAIYDPKCGERVDGKCYTSKKGTCSYPNSKYVHARNQDYIGLPYNTFREHIMRMSKDERKETLCSLSNKGPHGYPCKVKNMAEVTAFLGRAIPVVNKDNACENLVRFLFENMGKKDVVAMHITLDGDEAAATKDATTSETISMKIPITYRGYSKRMLTISKTTIPDANLHVYTDQTGTLTIDGKVFNVSVTSRL